MFNYTLVCRGVGVQQHLSATSRHHFLALAREADDDVAVLSPADEAPVGVSYFWGTDVKVHNTEHFGISDNSDVYVTAKMILQRFDAMLVFQISLRGLLSIPVGI